MSSMSTKAMQCRGGLSCMMKDPRALHMHSIVCQLRSPPPIFWRWPDHKTVPLSVTHPLKLDHLPLQSYFVVLQHPPPSLQRYPLQRLYFRRPWSLKCLWSVAVSSITQMQRAEGGRTMASVLLCRDSRTWAVEGSQVTWWPSPIDSLKTCHEMFLLLRRWMLGHFLCFFLHFPTTYTCLQCPFFFMFYKCQ